MMKRSSLICGGFLGMMVANTDPWLIGINAFAAVIVAGWVGWREMRTAESAAKRAALRTAIGQQLDACANPKWN
jgi:hypothetical protein